MAEYDSSDSGWKDFSKSCSRLWGRDGKSTFHGTLTNFEIFGDLLTKFAGGLWCFDEICYFMMFWHVLRLFHVHFDEFGCFCASWQNLRFFLRSFDEIWEFFVMVRWNLRSFNLHLFCPLRKCVVTRFIKFWNLCFTIF